MQNVRQEKLLAMLCEREGWMTSRQLARLLGVSDRTIRSDVDAINKRITPPPIESNVRLGYRMMEDARTGLFAPEKKGAGNGNSADAGCAVHLYYPEAFV